MQRKFYPMYEGEAREFAKAIVVGNFAFLSGVGPRDIETGNLPSEDVLEQTEAVVVKINSFLQEIGLSLANLVKHTIYVTQGENGVAVARKFHDVCYRYAPSLREEPDAGTFIYVPRLFGKGTKVEIDVIAAYTD